MLMTFVIKYIAVPVLLRLLENTLGHTFWNDTREYLRKE